MSVELVRQINKVLNALDNKHLDAPDREALEKLSLNTWQALFYVIEGDQKWRLLLA